MGIRQESLAHILSQYFVGSKQTSGQSNAKFTPVGKGGSGRHASATEVT